MCRIIHLGEAHDFGGRDFTGLSLPPTTCLTCSAEENHRLDDIADDSIVFFLFSNHRSNFIQILTLKCIFFLLFGLK